MPTGVTTTGALSDSLPLMLDSGRIVREQEGVHKRTCDVVTLPEGTGTGWEEISLAQLSAQAVTETTDLNNVQQLSDTMITITPTISGLSTIFTKRVQMRISKMVWAKTGMLAQNALERKKDQDYISTIDGATTSLCGAGTTLSSGHISAAIAQITSNTTEPSLNDALFVVLHGYQLKDIQDEITSGIGTYPVPQGMTEEVFRKGYRGDMYGASVFVDGNIPIDASDDAKGGVHSRMAIIMVQGSSAYQLTKERPEIGGGATQYFHYDEYAYGERSAGNWLKEIYSDALAPTA